MWLNFSTHAGHEQAGRRPGLVLSPSAYNGRVSLALICPVTSKVKGFPFEVALPDGGPVSGAILSDHVRSVDWRKRRAEFAAQADSAVLESVVERVEALLRPDPAALD